MLDLAENPISVYRVNLCSGNYMPEWLLVVVPLELYSS